MTREELVKQKAHSLGQRYFSDANNVWARANFEAQWVSKACEEMAEWEHKRLVDKACEWLLNNAHLYVYAMTKEKRALLFDNFKRTLEE